MRLRRYRGRHLKRRPVSRGPAVVGTATAMWMAGSQAAHAGTHVVRSGETLSSIAARYGTSVARLASANRLANPNLIIAGERLRIPSGQTMSASHVVQRGETLSSIAARYGTSVQSLAKANHIRNPNLIVAGTSLDVPSSGGSSSSAAAPAAPSYAAPTVVESSLENQAAAHGVDVALVKAVAWQESGWQQHVVSSAGAIGVMQVMPGTARYLNKSLHAGGLNVRKADDNVHLGVMYLDHMLSIMPGERKALAAYLAGPGNVGRKLTGEQRHYVRAVESHKGNFR